jgi:hypothetical protein
MVTNVTSSSPVIATGGTKLSTQQIKTSLTAALISAGVKDAKTTDASPKGFPAGTSWNDAFKMVTFRTEDNNPSTPGNLVLSETALKKALAGTQTLKDLGYPTLAKFPKGTSVQGALDSLFQNKSNGILASTLAKSGIYDLSAFPAGTTAYQAFKLIEDPETPGKISNTQYTELKTAYAELAGLGIKSLANFPNGTTAPQAKATLDPKASAMVSMVGMNSSNFKDPTITPLKALAILTGLPGTLSAMNNLPTGVNANTLGTDALAAKKLVSMGYSSLAEFNKMSAFASKPATASTALAQVMKNPQPFDLPLTDVANSERLFQNPADAISKSYGAPNLIKKSVYVAPASDRVTPNPMPKTTITTAAEVIARNIAYWGN